jgi:hypothetical protein
MNTPNSKKQHFFKRLRWYLISGVSVLLGVLALALVVRSPIFKIDDIEVTGVSKELVSAIKKDLTINILKIPRSALLSPKSYFAWPKDFAYSASAVSALTLEKSIWGKEIVFKATPRERYVIWCQNSKGEQQQCFWVDVLGSAFAIAPFGEGQLVRTIFSKDGGTTSLGATVTDTKTFSNIKKIIDGTKEFPVAIQKFEYIDSLAELHLVTTAGTIVRFSTRFDPNPTALPALRRLVNKPGLEKLLYANLTVENRAYLKYR